MKSLSLARTGLTAGYNVLAIHCHQLLKYKDADYPPRFFHDAPHILTAVRHVPALTKARNGAY